MTSRTMGIVLVLMAFPGCVTMHSDDAQHAAIEKAFTASVNLLADMSDRLSEDDLAAAKGIAGQIDAYLDEWYGSDKPRPDLMYRTRALLGRLRLYLREGE